MNTVYHTNTGFSLGIYMARTVFNVKTFFCRSSFRDCSSILCGNLYLVQVPVWHARGLYIWGCEQQWANVSYR